ncbi:FrgA protein [Myxococcus sp. RHSTA-1-4]|uniref:GspE/PulE/PilB domain-containing protein n=1 Tax=Myxococcus sp. RHSTA-1-4 TaxID=2874601 RepID=UPI001CBFCFFB|nr:FrgA protein [Myxococcus sp. RHSTA-1-4]MBZ4415152.1 FrgA protein [Myxococcus sp. RHSTA-1-4]
MPARLAQLLVSRMLLSPEKAGELLRQHQAQGGHLDTLLLERGVAGEADVLAMLGEVSGFRPVNLVDFEPNPDVASFIPPKIAERLCVVPLSLDGNTLHVACGYPVPKKELDEVGFLLGKPLEVWVAAEVRVREWVSTIYRQPLPPRFAQLAATLDPERVAAAAPPPPAPTDDSLTADMVERLARTVAQEPLPAEVRTAPREQAAPKRPETPAAAPQRPPPPPAEETNVPPPAFVRAPLRLNMPKDEAAARPAPAQPQRPAQQPAQAPQLAPTPQVTAGAQPAARPATPQAAPPVVQAQPATPQAAPPVLQAQPTARPATPQAAPPVLQAQPTTAPANAPVPTNGAPAAPRATPPQPPPSATATPAQRPATPGTPQVWPPAPAAPPQANAVTATGTPQVWPPGPTAKPSTSGNPPTMRFGTLPGRPGPAQQSAPAAEPSFLVFPNPARPSTPEPSAPATRPAPPPPAGQDVPDWTLAQARAALKEATKDRDRLIDVALRFGRRTFDYVAAFAVVRGAATGLEARGEGMTGDPLTLVSVPLDASSVFRTVAVTRGSYAGPLPPDALTRHYLELFGRQTPRTVFLYPVEVKGRLVAILYGDCGQKPISQRRLSDYILFCQDLPAAFQELILFRKQRVSELRAPEEPELTIDVDMPVAATPAPAPAVVAGLGWSPFFGRGAAGSVGRAAALPPRAQSQEERPPPDFAPLLKRLTGPDAAQRANAMAELARSPEASAKVLAQHFPGPTAWSRLPVVELPEADELGPIPGALSRLGRPAAHALAPLLDSQDADTRYFALLTAGNLPYVELVDGVLRGLFDLEPDISSAARVAASALKHLPRLDAALRDLRQELGSRDAMRRSLAARALGTLHDREAIEGLIQLTGSDDEMCAQAGAEALREVTRATFGQSPRQWAQWWAENRSRRRADWLVTALRHRELDVRLAAIEELSRALNDTLGYYADAPETERELAVRRWESAAVDPANARRLGML